jgi:hypothetical protein
VGIEVSISVLLLAIGTLIPPIFEGKIGEVVGRTSGQYVLLGIAVWP